jgi:glyoxylase-like metal-dependent hydrolase (beta-lactamase superfamily II)
MRLTEQIYLVGSGRNGLDLTDAIDCHVYLVDGGGELALVDAGGGRDVDAILSHIQAHGFNPSDVACLVLTHTHADHAAGAAELRRRTGCQVAAPGVLADPLRKGDADFISLTQAQAAGVYPSDFVFEGCPVDRELDDGDVLTVGSLELKTLSTPGHSQGHATYVIEHDNRTEAFVGDVVFFGGKILLQNIYDCDLQDYLRSIERLASVPIDGLFPGHGAFSLNDGARHVAAAKATIDRLGVPPNLI